VTTKPKPSVNEINHLGKNLLTEIQKLFFRHFRHPFRPMRPENLTAKTGTSEPKAGSNEQPWKDENSPHRHRSTIPEHIIRTPE
jgi:hypothetical protein